MGLPAWVAKHKTEGIEVHAKGGHFYACRITSRWDLDNKKRSKKVTLESLGKVTPHGNIAPRHKRQPRFGGRLDAGNIVFLDPFVRPLEDALKASLPPWRLSGRPTERLMPHVQDTQKYRMVR